MIDERIEALLEGPVMMVLATRGVDGRAALARGMGARREGAHDILVVASQTQWPEALRHLQPGAAIAFTLCRPTDYEAYQVKGDLRAIGPADEADHALAARYLRETGAVLAGLGVEPRQTACWLTQEGLVRLTFSPRRAFEQTPGPGAGAPLGAERRS